MSNEKTPKVGIDIEENPEGPYDVLRMSLPLPRFACLPKETRKHLRAARRERLLALRSVIDAFIGQLEKPE